MVGKGQESWDDVHVGVACFFGVRFATTFHHTSPRMHAEQPHATIGHRVPPDVQERNAGKSNRGGGSKLDECEAL